MLYISTLKLKGCGDKNWGDNSMNKSLDPQVWKLESSLFP